MRRSLEPWLIGGALLLALAAIVFIPIETCPRCEGRMRFTATFPCEGCGDRLKGSLWEKWREPPRGERDPDRY
jgi:hypothetical protein